ncbi:MAG: TIGR04086 family membrane protein [Ruminococcaceae bacterium]|nr:TIGR04086 family membrane protein [Oscillospiraceae bacterium]
MHTRKDDPIWMKRWVRPLGAGVLTGILACAISLLAMAALLLTQDTPQNSIPPLALVALVTGAFTGGLFAARAAGQNGWLMGLMTGGVLFLLLMTAGGFALLKDVQTAHTWVKLAVMLGASAVGGIVGINVRKRR